MPLQDTADTRLGQGVAELVKRHPGLSGIYPLPDGREAFAARVLLAQTAQSSLDVQHYIWHKDMSGKLLFEALHRAANRGVQVRLLLDDDNTQGLDAALAVLDSHANIEVRLFNPFATRSMRALGCITDFSRLNRRLHNKSYTADKQVTIIGGRNVGDEYFGAGEGMLFADLDVMAIGPVVDEVSTDFDRYWSSGSSYPAARILPPVGPEAMQAVAEAAARVECDPAAQAYVQAVRQTPFVHNLMQGDLAFEWAPARMVSDDPAKDLGKAKHEDLLPQRLKDVLGTPGATLELVSPYFVPTVAGVDWLLALARSWGLLVALAAVCAQAQPGDMGPGLDNVRVPLDKVQKTLASMPEEAADLSALRAQASMRRYAGRRCCRIAGAATDRHPGAHG